MVTAVDARFVAHSNGSDDAAPETVDIEMSDDNSQASSEQHADEGAQEPRESPHRADQRGDTLRSSNSSLCPGIAEVFVQIGGEPVIMPLTRAALRSLEREDTELSPEVVAILCAKMVQIVPYKRLRVLHPSFYERSVLPAVAEAWEEFTRPDPPIVCLPVFDVETGRWVLVVVLSKDGVTIVYYLDCKNPYGYVDGAGKKVAGYIESAYAGLAQGSSSAAPITARKVVQRGVELTPLFEEHASSSAIHMMSYFATIVRLLDSNQGDAADFAWLVGKAMYGFVLPRTHLLNEVRDVFAHVWDPKLCWGRSEGTGWWPCRRLSLRKETVAPPPLKEEVKLFEPAHAAVVWLSREDEGIEWLPPDQLKPLDEMTVDSVLRLCDASASITLEVALNLRAAYKAALANGGV